MHKGPHDMYEDIVDNTFHNLLLKLHSDEEAYYGTHHEYDTLKDKLLNSNIFPLIGLQCWSDADGIGIEKDYRKDKFTIEELRYLNNACDRLEEKINNTSAKIRADFKNIFSK